MPVKAPNKIRFCVVFRVALAGIGQQQEAAHQHDPGM